MAHPEAIADTGPPPDLVVTACFPRRLSRGLLRWPRAGGLNLHPSLLPAYRGPSPLFWQLRDGVDCGGITVHRLSEGLDAGDVVAAKGLSLPAGATAESLLESLVDAGAGLLIEALEQYAWDRIPCRPQGPGGLSYFPWPREEDFRFPATWSAERAFRFMRGTAAWGRPFVVQTARGALALERAVDFEPDARLDEPWTDDGERGVRVAFEPGVLSAVARPESLRPRP